jgi:hypothetical protein
LIFLVNYMQSLFLPSAMIIIGSFFYFNKVKKIEVKKNISLILIVIGLIKLLVEIFKILY